MKKLYIGIDEAGRGCLAGPLSVAGIATFDIDIFDKIKNLNDSKKLSSAKREDIFNFLKNLEKQGKIQIYHTFMSANNVDKYGIRESNKICMKNTILYFLQKNNKNFDYANILIDGSDNFNFDIPNFEYIFAVKKSKNKNPNQDVNVMGFFCEKNFIQFIIRGDESQKIISCASIIAKVERDSYMNNISDDFPEYNFDKNKGYGTKNHINSIINYGIKNEHRKTYEPIKTLISTTSGLL